MARWGWWLLLSSVTIDQANFEPVYRQLARILREQIQAGELHPGAAFPSEAAPSIFGVGRDAVRDALAALRSEGLVITTRGIGTFVREPVTEVTILIRAKEPAATEAATPCDGRIGVQQRRAVQSPAQPLRLSASRAPALHPQERNRRTGTPASSARTPSSEPVLDQVRLRLAKGR